MNLIWSVMAFINMLEIFIRGKWRERIHIQQFAHARRIRLAYRISDEDFRLRELLN